MPQLPSYLYLKKSTPQAPAIQLLFYHHQERRQIHHYFYFDFFKLSFPSIPRVYATANHQTP
jgi:hypothetical protein